MSHRSLFLVTLASQALNDYNAMNFVLLLILLMVVCDGCKKGFKNEHGLKRHRSSCHVAKAHTAALLQQRQLLQRSIKRVQGISKQDDEPALLESLIEDVSCS